LTSLSKKKTAQSWLVKILWKISGNKTPCVEDAGKSYVRLWVKTLVVQPTP
jgi:hypothetical protein